VQQITYYDETLSSMKVWSDIHELQENDWADYRSTIVVANEDSDRAFGTYAVAARKRRRTICFASDGAE
jgi:hypothetical protein